MDSSSRWKTSVIGFALLFFITLLLPTNSHAGQLTPDPLRLQKMVKRFTWQDAKNSFPAKSLLFIGSSSIYRWKTALAFPDYPVVNRGLPGAEISDINYFYDKLVGKYHAAVIVFYCGDNDIAAGKNANQILTDFKTFTNHLRAQNNNPMLIFLAIKPSPLRWTLWDKMAETNQQIQRYCAESRQCKFIDTATVLLNDEGQPDQSLFAADGIHLNREGYGVWIKLLKKQLQ